MYTQDLIEGITDPSDIRIMLLTDKIPEGLMPDWVKFTEIIITIEEITFIEMIEEFLLERTEQEELIMEEAMRR